MDTGNYMANQMSAQIENAEKEYEYCLETIEKSKDFLHSHPGNQYKLGLDSEHVIVDRKDWEIARKVLRGRNFPDLLQHIKDKMKADRDKARKEMDSKSLNIPDAKSFVIEKLKDIHKKFDNIKIRYEIDNYDNTHIIEILPSKLYENKKYMDEEIKLIYDFSCRYKEQDIMFISKNSLTEIKNPIFEL